LDYPELPHPRNRSHRSIVKQIGKCSSGDLDAAEVQTAGLRKDRLVVVAYPILPGLRSRRKADEDHLAGEIDGGAVLGIITPLVQSLGIRHGRYRAGRTAKVQVGNFVASVQAQ